MSCEDRRPTLTRNQPQYVRGLCADCHNDSDLVRPSHNELRE